MDRYLKILIGLLIGTSVSQASFIIPNASITGAKVVPQTLTQGLLALRPTGSTAAAGGVAISTSSGSFSTSSSSFVSVTGLSINLTTTGRPIFVGLIPDTSGSAGGIQVNRSTSGNATAFGNLRLFNTTTSTSFVTQILNGSSSTTSISLQVPCSAAFSIDFQPAGTYNYRLDVTASGSSGNFMVTNCQLIAYEL